MGALTIGCHAKSTLSFDDPLPFLRATLYRLTGEHRTRDAIGVWRSDKRSILDGRSHLNIAAGIFLAAETR